MTTTSASDDEQLFICSEPFAFCNDVCVRDEVVRESDPRHRANPSAFDPLGTPDSERKSILDRFSKVQEQKARDAEVAREAEFQRAAAANVVKLEARPPKVLRAVMNIATYIDGVPATVKKGSTILEGDTLAATHPDAFSPKR